MHCTMIICCRLENCRISEEGQAILQKFELDVTFIANVELVRELKGTEVDSKETSKAASCLPVKKTP